MTIPIIPKYSTHRSGIQKTKQLVLVFPSIWNIDILLKLDHVPETTIYSVYSMTSFPNLWSILFKAPGGP